MTEFEIGGIYRTENAFSGRMDGREAKSRWFIYLGKSGLFEKPVLLYLLTATTQIHHFQTGGDKAGMNYVLFPAGCCGFEADCAVCADELIDNMSLSAFEQLVPVKKGKLSDQKAKELYEKIRNSRYIMRKIKVLIHDSLNAFVSGLPMPK